MRVIAEDRGSRYTFTGGDFSWQGEWNFTRWRRQYGIFFRSLVYGSGDEEIGLWMEQITGLLLRGKLRRVRGWDVNKIKGLVYNVNVHFVI